MGRMGTEHCSTDIERSTLLWFHFFFPHADASQEDLEASVPQSTFSGSSPLTPEGKKTQALARVLRVLLESLDDLHRERKNIVKRAQRLADADDISNRVLKEASKFDKMADIQPLTFEEASDEELAKYDKFLIELREFEEKQNGILADVKVRRLMVLDNDERSLTRFAETKRAILAISKR
jgi:programmed cell death 6-interacting protein